MITEFGRNRAKCRKRPCKKRFREICSLKCNLCAKWMQPTWGLVGILVYLWNWKRVCFASSLFGWMSSWHVLCWRSVKFENKLNFRKPHMQSDAVSDEYCCVFCELDVSFLSCQISYLTISYVSRDPDLFVTQQPYFCLCLASWGSTEKKLRVMSFAASAACVQDHGALEDTEYVR